MHFTSHEWATCARIKDDWRRFIFLAKCDFWVMRKWPPMEHLHKRSFPSKATVGCRRYIWILEGHLRNFLRRRNWTLIKSTMRSNHHKIEAEKLLFINGARDYRHGDNTLAFFLILSYVSTSILRVVPTLKAANAGYNMCFDEVKLVCKLLPDWSRIMLNCSYIW